MKLTELKTNQHDNCPADWLGIDEAWSGMQVFYCRIHKLNFRKEVTIFDINACRCRLGVTCWIHHDCNDGSCTHQE